MFMTAAHAAEAGGAFPPFDTVNFVSQLVWLAITFGALYWLMSKVALPRVQEILETRRSRIETDLANASDAQKNADAAAAAYEKTLADAKNKAQATAQQMRAQIAAETEAKRRALEASLNEKILAAESSIAASRNQAMANVAAIAQDAAGDIVKRLTGRQPEADAVAAAIAAVKK